MKLNRTHEDLTRDLGEKVEYPGRKIGITFVSPHEERAKRLLKQCPRGTYIQPIISYPFDDETVLKSVRIFDPDLFIIGLMLYNDTDSGFRVMRRYNKKFPDVPIICISKWLDYKNTKLKVLKLPGVVDAFLAFPLPQAEEYFGVRPGDRRRAH